MSTMGLLTSPFWLTWGLFEGALPSAVLALQGKKLTVVPALIVSTTRCFLLHRLVLAVSCC